MEIYKKFDSIILLLILIILPTLSKSVNAINHLPSSILKALETSNEYAQMTSIFKIPFQALKTVISPTYILLFILFAITSIIFFKKREDIVFIVLFMFTNYLTYFFQTGIMGVAFARIGKYIALIATLLLAISAVIIVYNTYFKKKLNKLILPITLGMSAGMFYFPYPRLIERAFEFTLGTYSYFYKFLFSLKIFEFLIIHLAIAFGLVYYIKYKKPKWIKQTLKFINKYKLSLSYIISLLILLLSGILYIYGTGSVL